MFSVVPARDQQGRPEKDQGRGAVAGGCTAAPSCTFADLARQINPIVRGWMHYYGAFYRSALIPSCCAHQRLPDALDPQEIQTAAGCPEGPSELGIRHHDIPASSRTGHRCPNPLMTKTTRAV